MDTLRLRQGSLLRIDDGADTVVEVHEGAIWLTQERDRRDHYLQAHDWFRLDRDGTAVIAPVTEDARVSLTSLIPDRQARQTVSNPLKELR